MNHKPEVDRTPPRFCYQKKISVGPKITCRFKLLVIINKRWDNWRGASVDVSSND